jgi:NAD(P)-dependent dehydrogenase (short-subunit alcohol dehydrogenase family)
MTSKAQVGRIALITGSGRGVGLGIANSLVDAGVWVVINDIDAALAARAAADLCARGGRAISAPFNVSDLDAVQRGVEKITRDLGPVDILINNAGGGVTVGATLGRFKDSDPANWRKWIELDLCGSLNVLRHVLPGMVERHWGRVVQISSGTGSRGHESGLSLYGAAKAGIEAALRHIAMEEAKSGVTFNSIALGIMANNAGVQSIVGGAVAKAGTLAGVPLGRMGEPAEVGACVLWLTSELGGFVTGQTIHVNGGTFQGR